MVPRRENNHDHLGLGALEGHSHVPENDSCRINEAVLERGDSGSNTLSRTLLLITGMRDNGCREAVTRVLEHLQGVTDVQVNLYRASAAIVHEPTMLPSELIEAVERAGYAASIGRPTEDINSQ